MSNQFVDQMESGEINNFVIEKRYLSKNGSVIWAKTNVTAVRDHSGAMKYQVAIIEDITLDRERSLMVDMINNVAKSIVGKDRIQEIAWVISNNISAYLGAQDCVIYLVNDDKGILEQIAAYGENADVRSMHGWRRELFGNDALKLCKGELGLAIKDKRLTLMRASD